jgi:hypothetical protein
VPIETSIICSQLKTGESLIKSELFWIILIILFGQVPLKSMSVICLRKSIITMIPFFRYDSENDLREEDLVEKKDTAMNIGIVKQVTPDHKEWKMNTRISL